MLSRFLNTLFKFQQSVDETLAAANIPNLSCWLLSQMQSWSLPNLTWFCFHCSSASRVAVPNCLRWHMYLHV